VDLEWMAWTVPTATFFIVIFLILCTMTVWEVVQPTVERKGFLPIPTTRGDRLFIGLLGSAYIHLIWLATTNLSLWFALAISLIYMAVIMRYG
jgi:predicted small integral membrane protein